MTHPRGGRFAGELGAARELAELSLDPVFWGRGVPHGKGRRVIVLPGLFGNDLYLQPLHGWLARCGYRPVISSIPLNIGCPEKTVVRVLAHLQSRIGDDGSALAIIGHSRGGMLGWALAQRLGSRVSHLVALGSPLGAIRAASAGGRFAMPARMPAAAPVAQAGLRARQLLDPECDFPECGCAYGGDLAAALPARIRVTAIFSRTDSVVPPEAAPIPGAENIEVEGTHSGLVYNRAVYHHLGRVLAASTP